MAEETTRDGTPYYNHRVRLIAVNNERWRVEFKVTPTFSEGRSVEYTPVTPIHMPGSIQVYKNTAARTFNIGATLVSRNPNEAFDNASLLQTLRTWTMPYFGASTTITKEQAKLRATEREKQQNLLKTNPAAATEQKPLSAEQREELLKQRVAEGTELLGAPPMVLYLYAHSSVLNDSREPSDFPRVNINRVPVVITNLSFSFPNDVTYFPVSAGGVSSINTQSESFPTKMDITVDCVETHSPREYERFSLQKFHDGKLVNF